MFMGGWRFAQKLLRDLHISEPSAFAEDQKIERSLLAAEDRVRGVGLRLIHLHGDRISLECMTRIEVRRTVVRVRIVGILVSLGSAAAAPCGGVELYRDRPAG